MMIKDLDAEYKELNRELKNIKWGAGWYLKKSNLDRIDEIEARKVELNKMKVELRLQKVRFNKNRGEKC